MSRVGNWPLLIQTVAHILDRPEEWDQTQWASVGSCGTTACVAGWAAVFAGHRIAPLGDFTETIRGDFPVHVREVAEEELGLSYYCAEQLFDGDNKLEDILELVTNWAAEDGAVVPDRFYEALKQEMDRREELVAAARRAHPSYPEK